MEDVYSRIPWDPSLHYPTPEPEPTSFDITSSMDSLNIARIISDNETEIAELPNTSEFNLPDSKFSLFRESGFEGLKTNVSTAGNY